MVIEFVEEEDDLYSCDSCGELKPKDEMVSGFVYGSEGTFCHTCRHGENCDCQE